MLNIQGATKKGGRPGYTTVPCQSLSYSDDTTQHLDVYLRKSYQLSLEVLILPNNLEEWRWLLCVAFPASMKEIML